jgi:hypothetical protein
MPAGVNDSHTLNTLSSDIPVTVTNLRFVIEDSHAGIELEDSGQLKTTNSTLYLEGHSPAPNRHSTPSRVDSIEEVVFDEDILLDSTGKPTESIANLSGFVVYTLSSPELTQSVYLKGEIRSLGAVDNAFGVRSMESNDPRDIVSSFSPAPSMLSVSSGDELEGVLMGDNFERVRSWLGRVGVSSVSGVERVGQFGPMVCAMLFISTALVFPISWLAGLFLSVLFVVSFVLSLPQNYTGEISLSDPVDSDNENIVISASNVGSETVETVQVEQEENRLVFQSTESDEFWVVDEEVLLGESALSVMYDIGFENVDTDEPVEIVVSDSPPSESSARVRSSEGLTWWVRSAKTELLRST